MCNPRPVLETFCFYGNSVHTKGLPHSALQSLSAAFSSPSSLSSMFLPLTVPIYDPPPFRAFVAVSMATQRQGVPRIPGIDCCLFSGPQKGWVSNSSPFSIWWLIV